MEKGPFEKADVCKPGRELSLETKPLLAKTSIWDFIASKLWK